MKILILTGRFGMGHLKAAEAIKEELTLCHTKDGQKFDVEIIDWIEYLTPHHARSIYNGYSSLIRCNTVFYNLHYKSSENRPITQKPNLIGYVRMNQLIYEKQPDFIISVLACASNAAAYYKALSGSSIPLITCVTDITGHSEWINNYTDAYAVGSEEVRRPFKISFTLRIDYERRRLIKCPRESRDYWLKEIRRYHQSALLIRQNPLLFLRVLMISLLQMAALSSVPYCVYRALGCSARGPGELMTCQSILTLSASAMPTPGAVGAAEGGFLYAF